MVVIHTLPSLSCSENISLKISFKSSFAFILGTLRRWSLIFYGTTLDPLANNSRVAATPSEATFSRYPSSSNPSSQATKVRTTTALPPSRAGRFFSFYFSLTMVPAAPLDKSKWLWATELGKWIINVSRLYGFDSFVRKRHWKAQKRAWHCITFYAWLSLCRPSCSPLQNNDPILSVPFIPD